MQRLYRFGFAQLLLGLLLCTALSPAQARVVADLYDAVEAVPSRGASDRAAASQRGLERVFVRVTGDAAIGSNPQLAQVLKGAEQYLQSYRYESEDEQLYLRLSFEPQAISDVVRRLQLPIWPNNRPATLVWMAVDSLHGGRAALSQQDYPELFAVLDSLALERGLPVDFPVMDLNDQRNMPLGSLWAQDERAAEQAGVRYRPDATLMGRLLETGSGRWQANWLLVHGGRSYAFDASGASLEEVALRGIDESANLLAQRYAVRQGSASAVQGAVLVELSGIRNFAAYTEATSYLQGLVQVSSASVEFVDGDRLKVSLITAAPLQNLRDAIALNRKLQAQAEAEAIDLTGFRAPLGSAQNPLRYRWH